MPSHRGLFAQIEPRFWLNDPRIRSLSARDRGYYVDIWVMTLVQGHEVLRGWREACKHAWRSNDARTEDIVRRIAQPMPGRKPLLTIISDNLLRVTGSAKVHKRRTKGPQVVQPDVDVHRDGDVDVDSQPSSQTYASPSEDVDVPGDAQRAPRKTRAPDARRRDTATAGSHINARNSTPNDKTDDNYTPFPEARQWYDETTGPWDGSDFGLTSRNYLTDLVRICLKQYDKAQRLIAYTRDVDLAQDIKCKPAALLHRVRNGQHPPSDPSMVYAKELLHRGEADIDGIL